MVKEKKSTKQFKRKHLTTHLFKTREAKQLKKQSIEKTEKRQIREREAQEKEENEDQLRKELENIINSVKKASAKHKDLGEMSVDDFMTNFSADSDDDLNIDDDDEDVIEIGKSSSKKQKKVEEDDDDMGLTEEDDLDDEFEEDFMDDIDADEDDYELGVDDDGGVFTREAGESDLEDEDEDNMSVEHHMKELALLKEKDPELYQHLLTTDKSILQFGDNMEADVILQKKKSEAEVPAIVSFTKEQYIKMRENLTVGKINLKSISECLRMFKSAILLKQTVEEMKNKKTKKGGKAATASPQIPEGFNSIWIQTASSKLYSHFLQFAIKTLPVAFIMHLVNANKKQESYEQYKTINDLSLVFSEGAVFWTGTSIRGITGWNSVAKMILHYFHCIRQLLSDTTELPLLHFILRSILPALPLLEGHPTLLPRVLKLFLQYWAEGVGELVANDNFKVDNGLRIDAFLAIRRLCITLPPKSLVLEAALKGTYLAYVRCTKRVNQHTMPTILFLNNCIVELYSIDHQAAYQHAFIYIRQLAIHLRTAITAPNENAIRSVYNWQYLNCLRVWTQLVASHGADKSSVLNPLAYPLLQVCLHVIELQPSPAYFAVRFTIAEFVNNMLEKMDTYVPLSPYLLAVFNTPLFLKKGRNSSPNLQQELKYKLHASDSAVATQTYQNLCIERALSLLTQHLSIYSHSIAFPELTISVRYFLKRFAKYSQNHSISRTSRQLFSAIHENVQFIQQKRVNVTFCPKDMLKLGVSGISTFKNPDDIARLNNVSANKFAGKASKVGGIKQSPLETFWLVRKKALDDAEQSDIVLSMNDSSKSKDDDEEDEFDEDEDDEFDSTSAKTVKKPSVTQSMGSAAAKAVEMAKKKRSAAEAAEESSLAQIEDIDDNDDDDVEDIIEDFDIDAWSEGEETPVEPKKKLPTKQLSKKKKTSHSSSATQQGKKRK